MRSLYWAMAIAGPFVAVLQSGVTGRNMAAALLWLSLGFAAAFVFCGVFLADSTLEWTHDQRIVRSIFQRLVTPERTRAIVDASELRDISPDVGRIIGHLVEARLLVVHTRGDGEGAAAVELVHESLIKSWPTLQRWLDENQDDAAFLAQLRAAARQWDVKGRVPGLLWRNETMEEARLWRARYQRELPARDQDFLDAVFALANRAARIRRRLVVGAFVFLLALVGAAAVALVQIREAEQTANAARDRAEHETERATQEAEAKAAARAAEANARAAANAAEAKQRAAEAKQARDALEAERALQAERQATQNAHMETASASKRAAAAAQQAANALRDKANALRDKANAEAAAKLKRDEKLKLINHGDLK